MGAAGIFAPRWPGSPRTPCAGTPTHRGRSWSTSCAPGRRPGRPSGSTGSTRPPTARSSSSTTRTSGAGTPGWTTRGADETRDARCGPLVMRMGAMLYRRSPVGVVVRRTNGEQAVVKTGPRAGDRRGRAGGDPAAWLRPRRGARRAARATPRRRGAGGVAARVLNRVMPGDELGERLWPHPGSGAGDCRCRAVPFGHEFAGPHRLPTPAGSPVRPVLTAMVTPFDADGGLDLARPRSSPPTWSTTATTAWWSTAPPASRRPPRDAEKAELVRAVVERRRRPGHRRRRRRHLRHRAHRAAGPGGREGRRARRCWSSRRTTRGRSRPACWRTSPRSPTPPTCPSCCTTSRRERWSRSSRTPCCGWPSTRGSPR